MTLTVSTLLEMARFTVQNPREGARMVMRADVPMAGRWLALALMAVLSSIMTHLSIALLPPEGRAAMQQAVAGPLPTALLQGALLLVTVHGVYWVGRWRGGKGSFADALILMIWLQFILLILQVIQIAAQLVLPPLADIIGYVSLALFMWMLTAFITTLHGFQSMATVFFGIIGVLLVAGFVLAFVMLPFVDLGV